MRGSGGRLAAGDADPVADALAVGADDPFDDAGPLPGALDVADGCPEGVVAALIELVGFTGGDD